MACGDGDLTAVERLLAQGADPNRPGGDWLVPYLPADGSRKYNPVIGSRKPPLNIPLKYDRSSAENYALGSALLAAGADPERSDTHGATALYDAIGVDATEFALRLIREGVALNSQTLWYIDADEGTPLWLASKRGNLPVVNALLHAGAEIDLASEWGYTPLAQAVIEGHATVARELLEAGASPNGSTRLETDPQGSADLHPVAAAFGGFNKFYDRKVLLDSLVEAGGRLDGVNVVEVLARTFHRDVFEAMMDRAIKLDAFATIDADRLNDLLVAAARNPAAISALQAILALPKLDSDAKHAGFGQSALWAAYDSDNLAAAIALVKAGVRTDMREFGDGELLEDLAVQDERKLWIEFLSNGSE